MSCRHCRGLHCGGCRDRGGSVAALAGLAVIIALAVPQVWPRIAHAVEIAAWTTAALTGTVITMTAGVWLTRISRRRRARRAAERTAVRRQAGPAAGPRSARPGVPRGCTTRGVVSAGPPRTGARRTLAARPRRCGHAPDGQTGGGNDDAGRVLRGTGRQPARPARRRDHDRGRPAGRRVGAVPELRHRPGCRRPG